MAYRRSIISRTKSFYQHQQRLAPSFSHISTSDPEELHTNCISRNSDIRSYIHNRFLIPRNNSSNPQLLRNVFQPRRSEIGVGYGLVSRRKMSSASGGERVPSEIEVPNDTEVLNDMGNVVGDKAVEVAPVVNEVAVAAADSFSPVAALQYLVDYVHCYTGFNWWASIAVTTLLFRFIELPINIQYMKFMSKYSEPILQLQLATANMLKNKDDSKAEEGVAIMKQLVNKLSKIHLLGYVISWVITCSFFFAILNMAEKVPSFITGGTLWFTDLTTTNDVRLPILLGLTVWIRLKLNPRRHVKGHQPTPNMFCGALAFLGAAIAGLPNAMYCYWITSNLFSIAFSTVVVKPQVQKLLGMSMLPPSTIVKVVEASPKPTFSSSIVDRRPRKGEKGRKETYYKAAQLVKNPHRVTVISCERERDRN